jgi:hypothetical protein
LTTAARAETSPPVRKVHFVFSRGAVEVEIPVSAALLAVFAGFCPNIGQSEEDGKPGRL